MSSQAKAAPIFHLSFPVHDLEEAIAFYSGLGGVVGRRKRVGVAVALSAPHLPPRGFPEAVPRRMPGPPLFGAPCPWNEGKTLAPRPGGFAEAPRVKSRGPAH